MQIVIDKEFIAKVIGSRRTTKNNPKHIFGYSRIVDSIEYTVYERPFKVDKIVASYGDTVIKQRGCKTLIYIPDARVSGLNYHIRLNEKNFPGLQKNSKISQCLLLPYLRNTKIDTYIRDLRLCVITDKGQIFHNKPARNINYEDVSRRNDVVRFEESVIWDVPGRKHPTKSYATNEYECYYPGLPESCYLYSPVPNSDNKFVDKFNNGGYAKYKIIIEEGQKKICSRFYNYSFQERANPFFFIGTGNRNDKMCLIGTYRANTDCGTRICLFASSNGGREWFCKYEFSDLGEYVFQQGYTDAWGTNFGNKIALDIDLDCSQYDVCIYKRNIVLPDVADGKTKTAFSWEIKSKVKRIYGKDFTEIETDTPHGLCTGNIISFQAFDKLPKQIVWLNSKTIDEMGTNGGCQFKVRKIDDVHFEIYELVSSQFPTLPCRHIHHINSMKDGWIVGTGEIYPNGWLLYIQQKMADTFSIVSASNMLEITRLNTKESSVQRTMGMIIKDDFNSKVIFASDHDNLKRNKMNSTFLKNISRGSVGIFVGNLDDIDDRNKFECVCDVNEPCYYFQQLQDMFVFAGQRGELAICTDSNFEKWKQEKLNRFIMYYMGNYHNYHIFNDYIILRK